MTVSLFFLSLFLSPCGENFFERDGDGDRRRLFTSAEIKRLMTFLSLLFGK